MFAPELSKKSKEVVQELSEFWLESVAFVFPPTGLGN